ncbi:MAG: replication initiation protein [Burkholderiaceae bacterium]
MPTKKRGHTQTKLPQPLVSEQKLKKGVGAIHSSGKLTLVQRKLANVLLYSAYDSLQTKRTHTVPVSIMCAMLGWDASNRIDHLKDALVALQQTSIQFNLREDGGEVWESMSMLSYAKIKNGVCTYRYDEALAERLYDPAMFAMISLQVQKRIDSAHALNLYENTLRYKDTNTGSTGRWSLDFFREIVGGTASYYDDFRKLNSKIIKPAIAKINEVSDIVLDVEYEKQVRSVVALKFFVRAKTDEEKQAMQDALPGLSFTESVDEYKELRETQAFKALRNHNISERLAFAWIREKGEQEVLELVAYTEERDKNKQIKTTTSAYMRSLVDQGADLGKSRYQKDKEAQEVKTTQAQQNHAKSERLRELEADFQRMATLAAIKALTFEDRQKHAEAFIAEVGQGRAQSYNPGKADFNETVERANFNNALRKRLAPAFDQTAFDAWLKLQKR